MKLCFLVLLAIPCVLSFGGACNTKTAVEYSVTEKEHIYYDGETKLHGYLMTPDVPNADMLPGLLVLPYFMGAPALDDRNFGRGYAKKGMVVFVADYYGTQYQNDNNDDITQALSVSYPALVGDWKSGQRIATLALEQLTSVANVDADRVGVVGFCAGGTMASFLVRSGAKIAVALNYHGDPSPLEGEEMGTHNTKYFAGFFGRNDPLISSDQVENGEKWLQKSTADGSNHYEVQVFGNTVHSFTMAFSPTMQQWFIDGGMGGATAYNPIAAEATFERTDALFKKYGLLK